MKIRKYFPEDLKEIQEIFIEGQRLHAKERPDEFKNVEITIEITKESLGSINLVAEMNNEIVGFLIANEKEKKETETKLNTKFLFIEHIAVRNGYQNIGIGNTLMKEIEKIAQEKNIFKIELSVWGFNKNAQEFYKNLGYNVKTLRLEKKVGE